MEKDAQLVVRVPLEMQERLRTYAAQLTEEFGVPVSVAAAARRLLSAGLEQAGHQPAEAAAAKPAASKRRAKR